VRNWALRRFPLQPERSCVRSKASSLSALTVAQVSPVPFAYVTTDATAPAPICGPNLTFNGRPDV
jgi:hypothetical protein